MDTTSTVDVAGRAGATSPTVPANLGREGVARNGRGVLSHVPDHMADCVGQRLTTSASRTDIHVLAALAASPLGLGSARGVARVAGISPKAASAALRRLVGSGLVQITPTRSLHAGRVTRENTYVLHRASENWSAVKPAVRSVQLPDRHHGQAKRVPQRFWHLFWNSNPSALRVLTDGAYIARRMLGSSSMAAAQWALEHVANDDLQAAVAGRGADVRTKALVRNWVAAQGAEAR